MKADDFRFPLPPGSRVMNPVVTGGSDAVEGSGEAFVQSTDQGTCFFMMRSFEATVQLERWPNGRGAGKGGFAVLLCAGRACPARPDRERGKQCHHV